MAIDVSKDQKEVNGFLTFACRGESGDGTLGKNLCGCDEVGPYVEVASMFELLLGTRLVEYIVLEHKEGPSFHVLVTNDEKTRQVRDGVDLTSRAEEHQVLRRQRLGAVSAPPLLVSCPLFPFVCRSIVF